MNDLNGYDQRGDTEYRTASAGFFFARFIAEQAGQPISGVLARTAAWLSDIQAAGDVCLDLARHAGRPWPDQSGNTPALGDWRETLLASDCVALPHNRAPMTLDGDRLYLHRFWHDEASVADAILARLHALPVVDTDLLAAGLSRLFARPGQGSDQNNNTEGKQSHHSEQAGINWQQVAAALTVSRRFAVISGGPGTGKTTSLVKVLVLLLEQQPDMRIRMAAPTGKAAARMMESVREKKTDIATSDAIRAAIPEQAATLHRLLGYSPRGYRHDAHNPLMLDCLVIDEASMLDLPMMARLLQALPAHARLILLGDRDQLASVDAGNVLGDITGHGRELAYKPDTVTALAALCSSDVSAILSDPAAPLIANAIALLRTSYRFDADSGIGRLARSINSGDSSAALAMLGDAERDDLCWQQATAMDVWLKAVVDAYVAYLQSDDVAAAMDQFEQLRVLCAVRQGPVGVETVNQAIARQLLQRGLLAAGDAVHGMPVMVTRNNYALGLFNGDVGLLWRNQAGMLRGWFRQPDNTLRDIPVQSLPQYELCWAMTVHKSQGSEFDHVILLLPDQEAQGVLTRELFYTAVTRAKSHCTLYASEAAVIAATGQRISRSTGLAARLGWDAVRDAASAPRPDDAPEVATQLTLL